MSNGAKTRAGNPFFCECSRKSITGFWSRNHYYFFALDLILFFSWRFFFITLWRMMNYFTTQLVTVLSSRFKCRQFSLFLTHHVNTQILHYSFFNDHLDFIFFCVINFHRKSIKINDFSFTHKQFTLREVGTCAAIIKHLGWF